MLPASSTKLGAPSLRRIIPRQPTAMLARNAAFHLSAPDMPLNGRISPDSPPDQFLPFRSSRSGARDSSRERGQKTRRGWDSNPRNRFRFGGFQDRCIKPLCHLAERTRFSQIANGFRETCLTAEASHHPSVDMAGIDELCPTSLHFVSSQVNVANARRKS